MRLSRVILLFVVGCSAKPTAPGARCYPSEGACDKFIAAVGGAADLGGGERLFKAQCATCHGPDGRANGLKDRPDFTDAAWRDKWSDEELMGIIAADRGTKMPGFRLSPSEMKGVVAFVRKFAPKASPKPVEAYKQYGPR